jgi:tripartite ATP-independent transporter DctM subunit
VIGVIIVAFLVLVALSAPMAIAIGLAVVLGLAVASPFPITIMFQKMIAGTDNFILVSIPLFVLTGNLMNAGGITDRIFTFVRRCVGFVPGGLAYANVGSSVIFAGMQGSAVADAAALGKMEIKAMRDNGYTTDFAAAVTAASSVIGPIIPPSIPLILYGAIAEVSIGRLFAAGFLPGFLLAAALCAMIAVMDRWKHFPRDQRPSAGDVVRAFGQAFFALMTPAVILVGLLGGVFTPTEAGAVAVVYALILSFVVYRTVRFSELPGILVETMITTAIVLFIIANVSALSWTLAVTQSASALAAAIRAVSDNPLVFLLLVNLLLLFLGSFIEDGAVLILMTPILVPIAASLGIDLVHFGIVMVLNLMIGVALPPVGMSLFVTAHVAGISVERMFRAVLPFIVPMIITLLVVTYWPRLVLFVPSLLFP